jgi:hypothetical protein
MKNSGTVLQVVVQLAVVMLGLAVALPARAQSGAVDDISNTGLAAALSAALPTSPQYYGHPSREQGQALARQQPDIPPPVATTNGPRTSNIVRSGSQVRNGASSRDPTRLPESSPPEQNPDTLPE